MNHRADRQRPGFPLGIVLCTLALWSCDQDTSKHAGELGASCDTKTDCRSEGALCMNEGGDARLLRFCYVPCGPAQACPEDTFCTMMDEAGNVCVRECTTNAFCKDLNPSTDRCDTWRTTVPGQDPPPKRFCGIGG